jgi:Flp pilus assembly protein TadD
MLSLDRKYRPRLATLLDALKTTGSVDAFQQAYGEPLAQVQQDLQAYAGAQYLRGLAFPVALAPAAESPAVEPQSALLARLALAELLSDYPGKESQARDAYLQVSRDFPQRWEVEAALGRFQWRERRNQEAVVHFARAAELGSTDPHMFVTYARSLGVTNHSEEAVAALRTAIRLEPSLQEAHYDLGLLLMRTGAWRDALAELHLAQPVTAQQAPRYFYGIAYSEYRLGETIAARNHLEQGRPYTKIPEEVAALDRLSRALGPPVVEGMLETIECQGKVARLHVRVADSVRTFLIPDLTEAKDLACGPQTGIHVRLEFQAMPVGSTGADGIVRTLEFR